MDLDKQIFDDEAQNDVPEEFLSMSADAISQRSRLLDNENRVLKDESTRLGLEQSGLRLKIKENKEKIKMNNQLPYLVSNIVEVLDVQPESDEEEDGAAVDLDAQRQGKCVVLKTSTRQTIFLPVVGLVEATSLKPGDLVGVNKDSYLILDALPAEYDSRVKAMEVDEKPTEDYTDVGGLDKQIQELVEAVVLPIKHRDRFTKLGIRPPKVSSTLCALVVVCVRVCMYLLCTHACARKYVCVVCICVCACVRVCVLCACAHVYMCCAHVCVCLCVCALARACIMERKQR